MSDRQISHSVVVNASPEQVFALLADPRKHPELDGSGTVKHGMSGPDKLSQGARFGMRMRMFGLPYVISNEVVEYEENRRIAWRHFGHHVWRWELEPVEGGTKVTETFDWAPSRAPAFIERLGYPARNDKGIEQTLARLRARFA